MKNPDLAAHVYQAIRTSPGVTFDTLSSQTPPTLLADSLSVHVQMSHAIADLIKVRLIVALTADNKVYEFNSLIDQHDASEVMMTLMQQGLIAASDGDRELTMIEAEKEFYPFGELRFFSSQSSTFIHAILSYGRQPISAVFGIPDRDRPWPDVFVLMPFSDSLQPVYEDHMMTVCRKLGVSVGRADNFYSTTAIIQDIWSAINAAKVIIADCTGRNPNVFYEIGVAHTLGKDTVLMTQSMDDIPFDLRHLRIIVYDFTPRGMQNLEFRLQSTIQMTMQAKA